MIPLMFGVDDNNFLRPSLAEEAFSKYFGKKGRYHFCGMHLIKVVTNYDLSSGKENIKEIYGYLF